MYSALIYMYIHLHVVARICALYKNHTCITCTTCTCIIIIDGVNYMKNTWHIVISICT